MKMLAALFAAATCCALAEDDGKLVIDVPSSVQAVIAKEKGEAGKVIDFKKVNESDGTTYVIGFLLDGKKYVLALDAGGRLIKKQLEVDESGPKILRIEGVPVKVRATLQREAGAAAIDEIQMQEVKTTYVTEVKLGKRRYRIEVDADGGLLSKEYLGDDDGN